MYALPPGIGCCFYLGVTFLDRGAGRLPAHACREVNGEGCRPESRLA